MMVARQFPVLIVGAGPTGLMLALQLSRRGASFRIIEDHGGPGQESRALVVHARTLEFYSQLGLADRVVDAGTRVDLARLREHGKDVGTIPLREMGEGVSPYPFALCLPQDEHERLLVDVLAQEGVNIEWNTKLDGLEIDADKVKATLVHDGRDEETIFSYVAGCDGARSQVRKSLRIEMTGGEYDRLYYVADVKPRHSPGSDFVIALDKGDFALMLPARRGQNERLIGYVPKGHEEDPKFDDIRADVEGLLGVEIGELNWFSTYRVHHRVASRFHEGRGFLLGDAGHLHSPVGGQGMNTGIGDAVNLGWKLAAVVAGRASPALLESYEPERIGFARSLVATTDRAFQIITNEGMLGRVFRTWIMPHVVPNVARSQIGQHALFRLISQTGISYPDSPLSEGRAGISGGARLPWVQFADEDNFNALHSLDWQVHVYGEPKAALVGQCNQHGLPLHRFAWSDEASAAGLERNAIYLVRPDAHVALAVGGNDAQELRSYVARNALVFATAN